MRKALIGLILAATAMTPIAAEAQNRDRDGRRDRAERVQQLEQRGQERAARQAQRAEQREQRQEARQQQAQPQPRQERRAERRQRVQRQQPAAVAQHRGADHRRASQAWQGDPNDPRLRHYQELERRNQQRYGNDGRNDRGNWRGDRNDGRNWRDDNRGRRNWNRNWRNDNRYDWQRYRYSNRNIFHIGPYYSPYRGYGYNRFSIGIFLDPFFYDQRYWIGDPWQYRLPPAEPGTEWVRYYNDVLLVDVYTGEVIDVIYDFFW